MSRRPTDADPNRAPLNTALASRLTLATLPYVGLATGNNGDPRAVEKVDRLSGSGSSACEPVR